MRRLFVVLGASALLSLVAGPALAEEPFRLDDQIVDEAGVLGDESEIEAALDELQSEDGTQLFVVFVDDFGGLSRQEWMTETQQLSGLGAPTRCSPSPSTSGSTGSTCPTAPT